MCNLTLKKLNDMFATILSILLPVLLGIGGTWLGNKINNASLTGAQNQQNAFNSSEAAVQRDWQAGQNEAAMNYNAQEAEKARQFNKQQDDTLYQRRVADMQAAGVNPALAIGGVGSSLGSSAAGSISPASGAAASGSAGHFPQSMSDIMQASLLHRTLEQMDSQIQMNDAKTMRDLAEAGLLGEQTIGQNLQNSWFVPMKQAELDNLLSDLDSKAVRRDLDRQGISESEAREALTICQTAIAHIDKDTRDELNRASLRLKLAQAYEATSYGTESTKRLDLIEAQITETYQRAIMESLQGGYYSAAELESMERAGLIRVQTQGEEIGLAGKRYEADHTKVSFWLNKAGQAASIIGQAVGSAAFASGVKAFGKSKTPYNYGSGSFGKPSYSGKPFNAYYSKGSSLFTGYTQSW